MKVLNFTGLILIYFIPGDYERAMDSVEHFMAHSDYQESEAGTPSFVTSTPRSRVDKSDHKATRRNLNEDSSFLTPPAPLVVLKSIHPPKTYPKQSAQSFYTTAADDQRSELLVESPLKG